MWMVERNCLELSPSQLDQLHDSSATWLERQGLELHWAGLQRATVLFNLTSLTLQPLGTGGSPGCFHLRSSDFFSTFGISKN